MTEAALPRSRLAGIQADTSPAHRSMLRMFNPIFASSFFTNLACHLCSLLVIVAVNSGKLKLLVLGNNREKC